MKTKRHHILFTILVLAILMGTGIKAHAQDIIDGTATVQTLKQTTLRPVLFDLWLYGAASYKSHPNLWTANNNSSTSKHLYETFTDIGVETEVYKNPLLRLNASAGYKYERYAFDSGLSSSEGVYSHWLSTSLGMNYWLFCTGILSDIYLGSHIKNKDSFSYEGLYGDCFNRTSLGVYFGANMTFTRLKVEARIGSYLKPQLNPDKIAHYNLHKSHVNGLYWEIKLAYRLFTSGKHYNDALTIE